MGIAVHGKEFVKGLGTNFEASEGHDQSLTRHGYADSYCEGRNICVN